MDRIRAVADTSGWMLSCATFLYFVASQPSAYVALVTDNWMFAGLVAKLMIELPHVRALISHGSANCC